LDKTHHGYRESTHRAVLRAVLLICLMATSIMRVACASKAGVSLPRFDKLVVVVADRVDLRDLDKPALPNISRIINGGAIGLVSPNCLGAKNPYSVILTAGAGVAVRGGPFVRDCYEVDEKLFGMMPAGEIYAQGIGRHAPRGSGVFLGLGQAERANREAGVMAPGLGRLGEALRKAGAYSAAVGNADIPPDTSDRSASVLATDARGLIHRADLRLGRVVTTPMLDKKGPSYFVATDVGRLAGFAAKMLNEADLVVVNFGDTTRLDELRAFLAEEALAAQRTRSLYRLDRLVGEFISSSPSKRIGLVLVSLSPPLCDGWTELTPIVVYPAPCGLLSSATTRTPGLVTATDFAPTVLFMLGCRINGGMTGRPAFVLPGLRVAFVRDLDERVRATKTLEIPLLWVVATVGAICFTASSVIIAFGLRVENRVVGLIRFGLIFSSCAPLAMLIAVLAPGGVVNYAVVSMVVAVLVAGLALIVGARSTSRVVAPVVVFALTIGAVWVDGLLGGRFGRFSVPSAFPLSGFRFYGIGNEYAGVLIAMAGCLAIAAPRRVRAMLALVLGGVSVIVLGVGSFGANYGATTTGVLTLGLIWTSLARGGFGARHVIGYFVLGIGVSVVFAVLDWLVSGSAGTHGARLASQTDSMGLANVAAMAVRKVLFNLRIAGSTHAARVFAAFLPFIVLWFCGVHAKARDLLSSDPSCISALKGMLYGTAVALLINDSGIVFASIMLSLVLMILIYALLADLIRPSGQQVAQAEVKTCPE